MLYGPFDHIHKLSERLYRPNNLIALCYLNIKNTFITIINLTIHIDLSGTGAMGLTIMPIGGGTAKYSLSGLVHKMSLDHNNTFVH